MSLYCPCGRELLTHDNISSIDIACFDCELSITVSIGTSDAERQQEYLDAWGQENTTADGEPRNTDWLASRFNEVQ